MDAVEPHELLQAALAYSRRGWRVLVVHGVVEDEDGAVRCTCPKGANCPPKKMGKHAIERGWPDRATCDEAQIREWWDEHPNANIGIATGGAGIEVSDFDVDKGGLETLGHLEQDGDLGDPLVVETGGGGKHLIYQSSGRLKTRTGVLPGVDTRGAGGYVVAPPSRHASGNQYAFDFDAFEEDGDDIEHLRSPGEIPVWLLQRLQPDSGSTPRDRAAKEGNAALPPSADLIKAVEDALAFISSDDYDIWLQVGMALHHGLGQDGRSIWDDWSQTSEKVDPDDQQRTWDSFGRSGNRVTLGTLFHLAKEAGFNGPIPGPHDQELGIMVRRPNRAAGKVDFELLIEGTVARTSTINIRSPRGRNEVRRDLLQAAQQRCDLSTEELDQDFDAAWDSAEAFANRILAKPPRLAKVDGTDSLSDLNPETIQKLKAQAAEARDKDCERRASDLTDDQRSRAMRLGESPDLLDMLVFAVERLGHVGERENVAVTMLVNWSCRLPEPLHLMVLGDSSAGKSNLTSKCSRLVPPEFVLEFTEMTPKYLAHVGMFDLAAKVIVLGERELGDEELVALKTKLMREMISNGHITQATVETDGGTNQAKTKLVIGPVASSETTTKTSVFAEDRSRRIVLESDMSDSQTRKVLDCVGEIFDGSREGLAAEDLDAIHNLFWLLKRPSKIIVEFAPLVMQVLPDQPIEVRRLSSQILGLISVCAFVHQIQRKARDASGNPVPWSERPNGEHELHTHPRDYEIVAKLVNPHLGRALRRTLTGKERVVLEQIQGLVQTRGPNAPTPTEEFTSTELRIHIQTLTRQDVDAANLRKRLKALEAHGAIEFVRRDEGPHAPNRYRLLILKGTPDQEAPDPMFDELDHPRGGLLPETYGQLWEMAGGPEDLSPQAFKDEGVDFG